MSFDSLAPHYRWLELLTAGELLQQCRTRFVDRTRHARRVLLLGEGIGRFLAVFRRVNPRASVTCVDSSAVMIQLAQRRLKHGGHETAHVEWIHADALGWKPPREPFDLVATHFFLDCFRQEQIDRLTTCIASRISPGGLWLVSDFRLPDSGLARLRARCIVTFLYQAFRFFAALRASRLPDSDMALNRCGLRLVQREVFNFGLLHSDVWVKDEAAPFHSPPGHSFGTQPERSGLRGVDNWRQIPHLQTWDSRV